MQVATALKNYLQEKGWNYSEVGDGKNIKLKDCPYCGNSKGKFNIVAETTVTRCWVCGETGNLYTLKKHLGDLKPQGVITALPEAKTDRSKTIPIEHVERWHRNLLVHQEGLAYVMGRGITIEGITHFKLGLQKKDGIDWLTIPHLTKGTCANIKFRAITSGVSKERKWRRVKGFASLLYNEDVVDQYQKIVIAEAELDAVSWWCAGVKNVVGLTAGAQTFKTEWYDQLHQKDELITALDNDAAGQKGARDIARRLGFDKTLNVILPLHDANDVLMQLGPDSLARSLGTAERFNVEGVLRVGDVLSQCIDYRASGEEGLDTPWAEVNNLLGRDKFQGGDLVVVSATPKTGKTTWAMNIVLYQAMLGNPSLMYCLEMKPTRLGDKVVAIVRQKETDGLHVIDYKLAKLKIHHLPLFMIDPAWTSKLSADLVFEKIRETVKRYGIKFLVFDHLHFLCRSLQHMTNEVGNVTKGFKLLAEELDIVIMLIAQPGKIKGSRVMNKGDLKHSSDIPADADWIIILHRDEIPAGVIADGSGRQAEADVLDPKTLIRVDGARFQGGGEVYLHYEGARSVFMSMSDRPPSIF